MKTKLYFRPVFPIAIAAAGILLVVVPAVVAQAVGVPPTPTPAPGVHWWNSLIDSAVPVIGIILMTVITWASALFGKKTGIEIGIDYRYLLHEALMNGIKAGLKFLGWKPGDPVPETAKLTQFAAAYVGVNNAETLKHFDLKADSEEVRMLASGKIADAIAQSTPAPAPVIVVPAKPVLPIGPVTSGGGPVLAGA